MKRKAKTQRSRNSTENSGISAAKRRRGNVANLRPHQFPKGVSGNPGGRPRDPITAALRKRCDEKMADAIAKKILDKAKRGSVQHFKEATDRIEGKATQRIDVNAHIDGKVEPQTAREKLFARLDCD